MLLPTPRLAGWIAAGAVALLPGCFVPALLPLGLLWNLALLILTVADWRLLPRPSELTVERRVGARLAVAGREPVKLLVHNHGGRPVTVWLRDAVPPEFATPDDPPPLRVAPGYTGEARYLLPCERRGQFRFGGVTARWTGDFGLLCRQHQWPLDQPVRVYPNLRALTQQRLLERAGRLLESGVRAARLRGAGTAFESLRDYQPDDEYRRIDWSATARRGRLVSRQYEVERRQTLLLCLDVGRLMTTRLGDRTRLDHAIDAILLLASVAMRLQDAVGLLVFAEEPLVYLPPRAGPAQMAALLDALYDQHGRLIEPDYGAAFRLLGLRQRKRAMVVLFTDLVDSTASQALLDYAGALRPAHLPILVSLTDPELVAAAHQRPADLTAVHVRAQAHAVLTARELALGQLTAQGLAVVDSLPEQAPTALLSRYLEAKVRLLL